MTRPLQRTISGRLVTAVTGIVVAVTVAACGAAGAGQSGAGAPVAGPLHGWTPPRPEPLSPVADYRAAVNAAISRCATSITAAAALS